ncbi:MAG: hypothetical protein ACO3A4_01870 [Silvanigrellaceae bacterium]
MMKHKPNSKTTIKITTQVGIFVAVVGTLVLLSKARALDANGVCKQQTIFGLVGTKSCVGQDDGSGTVPTPTDLTTVDSLPSISSSAPKIFNTPSPTIDYTKICSNQYLLGRVGEGTCAARISLNHLDKSGTPSNLNENFSTAAPNGRLVPKVKDDDGESGTNVTKFDRTGLKVCGTDVSKNTLALKIADCSAQNTTSNWLGSNGNSGHGNWTLVMASDGASTDGTACVTCKEIWRDDRTGLLWSDRLATDQNWCKASGANLGTVCSNTTNQPSPPESLCAEDGTRNTSNTYNVAKGNMLLGSANQKVRWWLPTRYDWMEAEENGIRFVLPNITANFWTSSADSANLTQAWIFKNAAGAGGALDTLDMLNETTSTRCIGQAIP